MPTFNEHYGGHHDSFSALHDIINLIAAISGVFFGAGLAGALSANRFRLVGWHLFRNAFIRPEGTRMMLPFGKSVKSIQKRPFVTAMALVVSVLGLPFVVLLVLMDDYV